MKKFDRISSSSVASSATASPARNLEEMLRATRPGSEAPADLHDEIMFQVRMAARQAKEAGQRSAGNHLTPALSPRGGEGGWLGGLKPSIFNAQPSTFRRVLNLWRWMAVPAAAVVLLALAVYLKNPARVPGTGEASLLAAAEVLPAQRQMAGELTATAVAPLHEEMDRLEKDINRAAAHLLANIP